ncbi:MAG TPA: SAM-dependent methyltransferase, partial [Candidatus Paceibacterota bacterium]|nr:SAM-dependent methyltransferase [Candidatus Paceibacterota bacterium]
PIPGANAAIAALSISGFPADNFIFLGFPPHKKGRQTFFKKLIDYEKTIVFYESKHRIIKTLDALSQVMGLRALLVARELTKQFETLYRGVAQEILQQLNREKILGEFVIVIAPKKWQKNSI